jgi:hypothetical protein
MVPTVWVIASHGLCTRGSNMALQMIFGITATTLSMYLWFSRLIHLTVLVKHTFSSIRVPKEQQIKRYKECVQQGHTSLKRCMVHNGWLEIASPASRERIVTKQFL